MPNTTQVPAVILNSLEHRDVQAVQDSQSHNTYTTTSVWLGPAWHAYPSPLRLLVLLGTYATLNYHYNNRPMFGTWR